jgi:hypothetical protein
MLEPDLIAYLIAHAATVKGEVHLGNVPQGSPLPAYAVVRVGGLTPRTLNSTRLFQRANLQIHTVGADRYAPTQTAANELRELLDNFKGPMGDTYIESCRCEGEPADNSFVDGNQVYRQLTQDFRFVYRS